MQLEFGFMKVYDTAKGRQALDPEAAPKIPRVSDLLSMNIRGHRENLREMIVIKLLVHQRNSVNNRYN